MNKTIRYALALFSLSLLFSTASSFAREKRDYKVQVVFDRGLEGKTEEQQKQLNQVGERLEAYVLETFADNGVKMEKIGSREKFDPASGQYLLTVKMVNYNPGSKAARMLVGLGAGATSLDLHYELLGAEKDPLLTKDHGRGSSRDWTYLCRTLGKDIFKDVDAVVPKAVAPKESKK